MASSFTRTILRTQDRLLSLLGNTADGRPALVANMLKRDASEATSYWLQLVVSVAIATLGLIIGSTAVVIGAMLVAPLMGPIIGLAMGLASGSPYLVIRSSGRIGFSVLVAVGGAALITVFVPFHELTAEISARTSPTVLDLITAGFCAVVAAYSSLRAGSDMATTAAGTAISISLVPPLCASGFGVGTWNMAIASGAGLLFLTNLVAIVVVGTVAFVASGFNRVGVAALERKELQKASEDAPISRGWARRLSKLFESKWGPALRFLMPFLLLAAVYLPLRRALDEVAWEVRVRSAVRATIENEKRPVVESRVRVERHKVDIVVVMLGKAKDAAELRTRMDAEVRQISGVAPTLQVLAVPDANALAGLESTLLAPRKTETPAIAIAVSPNVQLDSARDRVRSKISELWPSEASGAPLAIEIGTTPEGPLRIRIVHLGLPVSPETLETLRKAAGVGLQRDVAIDDVAVPVTDLTRRGGDFPFVTHVSAALQATLGIPGVNVCVVKPSVPKNRRRVSASDAALASALDPLLKSHPRVTTSFGKAWSVRFVDGPCNAEPDAGAP